MLEEKQKEIDQKSKKNWKPKMVMKTKFKPKKKTNLRKDKTTGNKRNKSSKQEYFCPFM